jgi:hypothetical protein
VVCLSLFRSVRFILFLHISLCFLCEGGLLLRYFLLEFKSALHEGGESVGGSVTWIDGCVN